MKQCPVCKESISDSQLVCGECMTRIQDNEQPRREAVLYTWGKNLMIFLAVMFFLRGMFALLDPKGYMSMGESIGFRIPEQTVHYMNTSLLLLIGILYGIAWLGSYLQTKWHRPFCFVILLLFIIGELAVQLTGAEGAEAYTRAMALVFFWISIPVFQYAAFKMGKPRLKDSD